MKITFKDVVITLIFGAFIAGFAFCQNKKECEAKLKLFEAKQKLEKTIDKLVDALEVAVEKTTPKPAEVWKTIAMDTSAYCPCEKCCGIFADGITASGHQIVPGDVFVAAPRKYPFGTEMVIEGYAGGKVVKVEDVGGAIKGNKLDLFFSKHQQALDWGRKQVDVRVRVRG